MESNADIIVLQEFKPEESGMPVERNIDRGINYSVVSGKSRCKVISLEILVDVRGSDHCPAKTVPDL